MRDVEGVLADSIHQSLHAGIICTKNVCPLKDTATVYSRRAASAARAHLSGLLDGAREDVARAILADDIAKGRAGDDWGDGAEQPWLLDNADAALAVIATRLGLEGATDRATRPATGSPATQQGDSDHDVRGLERLSGPETGKQA